MKKTVFFCLLFLSTFLYGQKEISGKITDSTGLSMPQVKITEQGTSNSVFSDDEGNYKLIVKEAATLLFSKEGFTSAERSASGVSRIDLVMKVSNKTLEDIVVVGSRSTARTKTSSAVPVDVINLKDVTTQSGKIEINELLQYVAPSFNANKQSGSDGADHVDPASLRGLGPDQSLVLINGKRRHQSSLVNLYGSRGRGNTGTDLNAIPASSIKRIEILRDGAAAQYGSDAIAGVINIVLNDNVNELTGAVTYGTYYAVAPGSFLQGTANTQGNFMDLSSNGNTTNQTRTFDGAATKIQANYGVAIGDKGGYINFTTEFLNKEKTLRPGYDFRKGFGEAGIVGFNLFANMMIPVSDKTQIYAFGGRNFRDTDAFAFTRNGGERVIQSIYPGGFTPRITSNILDQSLCAGIRTEMKGGWKMDFSNTYGKNLFHYYIKGTLNASMLDASPTEFDAGGHSLAQNTTNIDFSKKFNVLNGLNLAMGGEYRTETFTIFAGEEGSYATYDTLGKPIIFPATQVAPYSVADSAYRPGGSQGFPGYSPANAVDKFRTNSALYADAELDVTKKWLISGAVRFEKYSDFGNTLNGKFATRYSINKHINLRGSVSTGFRAPSLAQIYYNLRFTQFNSFGASEVLLSSNDSPITKAYGIDKLKQEKSVNASFGITGTFGNFTGSIDGYLINVTDRIVLTGYFDASNLNLGVSQAQFFANGVNTQTKGVDVVLSWKKTVGHHRFGVSLVGNYNEMSILKINNNALDQGTFFGKREEAFLLASAPKYKAGLNLTYTHKKFNAGLSFTHFAKIVLVDYGGEEDVYSAKTTTDLTLGYKLSKQFKLSVGCNNLFNVYPDKQDEQGNTEGGGYWDSVQMGFGGAYLYARLGFTF